MGPVVYIMRDIVDVERNFTLAKRLLKISQNSRQPITATGKINVSQVKEIIKSDGRYTVRDIAKAVCISLSRVHSF